MGANVPERFRLPWDAPDSPRGVGQGVPAALRSQRSEDAGTPSASPAQCAGYDGA